MPIRERVSVPLVHASPAQSLRDTQRPYPAGHASNIFCEFLDGLLLEIAGFVLHMPPREVYQWEVGQSDQECSLESVILDPESYDFCSILG